MNLRPIVTHSDASMEEYNKVWLCLEEKIKPTRISTVAQVTMRHGYAKKEYNGTLAPEYGDLTELEIAMLCDRGFSWFGGTCYKTGLNFNATIYID